MATFFLINSEYQTHPDPHVLAIYIPRCFFKCFFKENLDFLEALAV